MLSLHDIFDKIKTKFQELECEWTGQMEEYTKKNSPPPKRSFSSSKRNATKPPYHVRIASRSSTGDGDFFIKSWAINFLSGLLFFPPGSPVGY